MKPGHPYNHDDGEKSSISGCFIFIFALLFLIACIILSGCAVTTAPDGTVTKEPDYNAWLTIAEMIANWVVPPTAIPVTK